MKRFLPTLLLAVLLWAPLAAQIYEPYLSEGEVTSSVRLLPPPPEEDGCGISLRVLEAES